jgi:deoxyxylulose-5-phosphate synthase
MKVIQLSNTDIMQFWNVLEPAISKALATSEGEANTYYYLNKFSNNDYQCWVVLNEDNDVVNVSTTRINTYPEHKSLHILTTTSVGVGKWKEYKEAHHAIEQYAREQGCKRIEMYGRKGWSKVLNKLLGTQKEKYKEVYVVHSMELTND